MEQRLSLFGCMLMQFHQRKIKVQAPGGLMSSTSSGIEEPRSDGNTYFAEFAKFEHSTIVNYV